MGIGIVLTVLVLVSALASIGGSDGKNEANSPPPPPPAPPPPPPPADCSTTLDPGGNITTAFKSLTAGETLCLHGGAYPGEVTLNTDGTAANPVTLRSFPGETAIIDGRAMAIALLTINSDYANVIDLTVRRSVGPGGASIWGNAGSDHVLLSQLDISSLGGQGIITAEETNFYTIDRNYIHDIGHDPTRQTHGIYLQGNDHRVSNNLVVRIPFGFGIVVYDYARRARVVSNTVAGGAIGPLVFGGRGVGREGLGVSDVDIVNNVFSEPSPTNDWAVQCYQSPTNYRIHDNLGFHVGSFSNCDLGEDNPVADPLYVRGFHLADGSPGIDTGDNGWLFSPDLDGVIRPQGLAVDRGAYER